MKPERVQAHSLEPDDTEPQNLTSDRGRRHGRTDHDERLTCETAPWHLSRVNRTRTRTRRRLLVWQATPASRPGDPGAVPDDQILAA